MKTVILAGGRGSRLGAAAGNAPKPLVEVAGRPILERVMDIFVAQGHAEFIIALGYRSEEIRQHFGDLAKSSNKFSPGLTAQDPIVRSPSAPSAEPQITLVDTGIDTPAGGRVRQLAPYLEGEPFFMTWCDGIADIDLSRLLDFHRSHGRIATVTAVHPPPRFGRLRLRGDMVASFEEKPPSPHEWINGAFFVLEPEIFAHIDGYDTDWERQTMPRLARLGELMAYRHEGYWQCMDTPTDRDLLDRRFRELEPQAQSLNAG